MGFIYFVIILSVGIGMFFTGRSMGIEWALENFLDQLVANMEEQAKEGEAVEDPS